MYVCMYACMCVYAIVDIYIRASIKMNDCKWTPTMYIKRHAAMSPFWLTMTVSVVALEIMTLSEKGKTVSNIYTCRIHSTGCDVSHWALNMYHMVVDSVLKRQCSRKLFSKLDSRIIIRTAAWASGSFSLHPVIAVLQESADGDVISELHQNLHSHQRLEDTHQASIAGPSAPSGHA